MATLQEITDYYVQRMAAQYRDKPKARATVALYIKQAVADFLAQSVENAFGVDTAVGAQLDTIGKYVGVPRNIGTPVDKPYFGFSSYEATDPQNPNGFTSYTDDTVNAQAIFLQYQFADQENTFLPDTAYDLIIRLKIILNVNDGTLASIQGYLHTFLPGLVAITDNQDMTLTYTLSSNTPVDPNVLKAYLPKPMGVGVNFIFVTVSAAPSTRSAAYYGPNPFGHTVTTGASTGTVTGAVGAVTYQWQRISGDAINADTPLAAATTFSYFFDFGITTATKTAVFQLVVRDSRGLISVSNQVTVTIQIAPTPP